MNAEGQGIQPTRWYLSRLRLVITRDSLGHRSGARGVDVDVSVTATEISPERP
jgi:hypothetical protein